MAQRRAERKERRAAVTDTAEVMDAAATFLAARPRSVTETRRRLRHLGYAHALVDEVIDRLVEMKYLDDASFARAWVESRDRSRPRGDVALRRELALKGVPKTVIDDTLAQRIGASNAANPSEQAAAALLERRRPSLERERDPRRRRQKAYALLARSGFEPDVAADAVRQFTIGDTD